MKKDKKQVKKQREEQKEKLAEWIKEMGGKVQTKEKTKPKESKESKSKNSPNIKLTPLLSDIFTQKLTHILETAHEYQEITVIASRGEGKTYTAVH
jgi:hypothetical protein